MGNDKDLGEFQTPNLLIWSALLSMSCCKSMNDDDMNIHCMIVGNLKCLDKDRKGMEGKPIGYHLRIARVERFGMGKQYRERSMSPPRLRYRWKEFVKYLYDRICQGRYVLRILGQNDKETTT
ncbi:hypothetical protein J1N35_019211 [Gossypium stocksii]|uniref:Uncharacterized protein n=1 Tax=Gossypium stocksii TaxID=47602 RepID=A0A9D3VQY6_9ROSI|nr:hypothetical protein J1N35_019211 [Gossypium stocksii]